MAMDDNKSDDGRLGALSAGARVQEAALLMDSQDQEAWSALRRSGDQDKPRWLAERFARACVNGSLGQVELLLGQGADPRGGDGNRQEPYEMALFNSHDAVALVVIKAGAKSYHSSDATAVMSGFAGSGSCWRSALLARDVLAPGIGEQELLRQALERFNMRLALDAARQGVHPSPAAWKGLASVLSKREDGAVNSSVKSQFVEWAQDRENTLPGGAAGARLLFKAAIDASNAPLLGALLDSGLSPGADWMVDQRIWDHGKKDWVRSGLPLIWVAAKLEAPEMFEMSILCPPALRAARSSACSPALMADVQIGRLVVLHSLGVDLAGRGPGGGGLAHEWARVDAKPRDGWATMAKMMPEVFGMKDDEGRSGMEAMAERLGAAARAKFLAAMARVESREIKAAVGKAPPPGAPKRRL